MNVDAESSPGFLIGRVSHLLRSSVNDLLKKRDVGLTPEQCIVSYMLWAIGEPASMTELSSMMQRDATTLTRQVDGLEAKGLVTRGRDATDRRRILVELTEDGTAIVNDKLVTVFEQVRRLSMKGISHQDADTLIRILKKILGNLDRN